MFSGGREKVHSDERVNKLFSEEINFHKRVV